MINERIIPNGTEVLIFSRFGHETKPITTGVIVNSKDSGDLSTHGSPWSVQVYEVLGDNGLKYFGTCNNHFIYDDYFRTRENYINYLKRMIEYNNRKINELNDNNNELRLLIEKECLSKQKQLLKSI